MESSCVRSCRRPGLHSARFNICHYRCSRRPGPQCVFSPKQLPDWIWQKGQTQLWRYPRHCGRVSLHPLYWWSLGEIHGLHLWHVLPAVLVRSKTEFRQEQFWHQQAGGGGGVHQTHLGAGHLLRQWEDCSLPPGHHRKPISQVKFLQHFNKTTC